MAPLELLCFPSSISLPSYKPRRSNGIWNGRMATTSFSGRPSQRWSLDDLSSELLALIFDKLRDVDTKSLAAARRLSRRLDAIITSIQFETLRLNERIIAPQAEAYLPQALEKIYAHTRHIEARSDLNPENVKRVLDRIERLLSVRWSYAGADFRSCRLWMPSDILSPRHIQTNKTKLYVEDLPLRDFNGELQDTYVRAIPTSILISLKMASPTPPLTTRLESLKRLLLESRRIETFQYDDRGQGTRFSFLGNERLPAFKELTLRSYDWNHNSDMVEKHWDFSRIRHLNLIDVPMFQFLTSVSFPEFSQLQTLHLEDFSAHLTDRRQEATRGLYVLIRQIWALDTLKITCHTQLFPVDGLIQHAKSLRVLRFRDHAGFGDEERRCPTMWVEDLDLLSRSFTALHTLELDMDVTLCEPPLFLRALCNFPRLNTLTLHMQTVLRPLEKVHPGVDRDREAAMKTFSSLIRGKQGAPWRSITINVGGWRRVMVRRMSPAWREQNRRGVYAERCFVLERTDGQMTVREEVAVES